MAAFRQFSLDFSGKRPPSVQAKIAEGMAQAEEHANSRWKAIIAGCILAAARRLPELTVDDVLEEYAKLPENVRPITHAMDALGPSMVRAKHEGILHPTGKVVRSKRPITHGNRHSVWQSNYYRKESTQ